jgi:hypothetical protein
VISVWKSEIDKYSTTFEIISDGYAIKDTTFPKYKFNCTQSLIILSYEYIYNYFKLYTYYNYCVEQLNQQTLIYETDYAYTKFGDEHGIINILKDSIVICDESQYLMRFFYLRPDHKKIGLVNETDVLPNINVTAINQI